MQEINNINKYLKKEGFKITNIDVSPKELFILNFNKDALLSDEVIKAIQVEVNKVFGKNKYLILANVDTVKISKYNIGTFILKKYNQVLLENIQLKELVDKYEKGTLWQRLKSVFDIGKVEETFKGTYAKGGFTKCNVEETFKRDLC